MNNPGVNKYYYFRVRYTSIFPRNVDMILSSTLCKLVYGYLLGLVQNISDNPIDDSVNTGDIVEGAHRDDTPPDLLQVAFHQVVSFEPGALGLLTYESE